MAVSAATNTPDRSKIADFTFPYYTEYLGVLFKPMDPSVHNWKYYFQPFEWKVWFFLIASSVLVMGVFCGITYLLVSRGLVYGYRTQFDSSRQALITFITSFLNEGKILK